MLAARRSHGSATGARSSAARRSRSIPHAAGRSRQSARRSSASSPAASRSTASTPASASSPACGSCRPISRASAQHRVVARRRRRRADADRRHAADDGAEARSLAQGASGMRQETLRLLAAMLERGMTPVVPCAGLSRRIGRSRAAGPHGRGDDRRGRGHARRSACRRPRPLPRSNSSRSCSIRRRAWRSSTARSSRPRTLVGLFEAETLLRAALATGALSPDAAAARIRRSTRASMQCAASRPAGPPRPAEVGRRQRDPRLAPVSDRGCRIPIVCAASPR